jgi:hypothetical protein
VESERRQMKQCEFSTYEMKYPNNPPVYFKKEKGKEK